MGWDWCEAQALIREPHGRVPQYSPSVSLSTGSASPRKRTTRNSSGQPRDAATRGLAAISTALVDPLSVTNPGPRGSRKRINTVRTLGAPSASTVANASASPSGASAACTPAARAWSIQRVSWA